MVQRVVEARVAVGDFVVGKIGPGLCLFLGVGHADDENSADQLAEKVKNLRIFDDAQGKMNLTLPEMDGEVLVISQFTLYGDCRKGNRPSFTNAAAAELAERLYRRFVERLRASGVTVATGQFQAKMRVSLINDGPATFILEG